MSNTYFVICYNNLSSMLFGQMQIFAELFSEVSKFFSIVDVKHSVIPHLMELAGTTMQLQYVVLLYKEKSIAFFFSVCCSTAAALCIWESIGTKLALLYRRPLKARFPCSLAPPSSNHDSAALWLKIQTCDILEEGRRRQRRRRRLLI